MTKSTTKIQKSTATKKSAVKPKAKKEEAKVEKKEVVELKPTKKVESEIKSANFESKYFPKWYSFPREEHCWREFATQAEAMAFKEKTKDVTSICSQPGYIWQVSYWKKFDSPEALEKDWEDRMSSRPEKRTSASALEQMTDEEANERLQKKITTERKSRKKKEVKKKK